MSAGLGPEMLPLSNCKWRLHPGTHSHLINLFQHSFRHLISATVDLFGQIGKQKWQDGLNDAGASLSTGKPLTFERDSKWAELAYETDVS